MVRHFMTDVGNAKRWSQAPRPTALLRRMGRVASVERPAMAQIGERRLRNEGGDRDGEQHVQGRCRAGRNER